MCDQSRGNSSLEKRRFRLRLFALIFLMSSGANASECLSDGGKCKSADLQALAKNGGTVSGCFASISLKRNVCYSVTARPGFDKSHYAIFLHGRGADRHHLNSIVNSCERKMLSVFFPKGPPLPIVSVDQTVHTYWKNSKDAAVADMVTKDLVQELEKEGEWRMGPQRSLVGVSMGGHGAIFLSMTNPKQFGAVVAISPIFRSEQTLEPEDVAGFGRGAVFQRNDPLQILRERGFPKDVRYWIEIAKDDSLFKTIPHTQQFFKLAANRLPNQVHVEEIGGHGPPYWCSALRRGFNSLQPNAALTAQEKPKANR